MTHDCILHSTNQRFESRPDICSPPSLNSTFTATHQKFELTWETRGAERGRGLQPPPKECKRVPMSHELHSFLVCHQGAWRRYAGVCLPLLAFHILPSENSLTKIKGFFWKNVCYQKMIGIYKEKCKTRQNAFDRHNKQTYPPTHTS